MKQFPQKCPQKCDFPQKCPQKCDCPQKCPQKLNLKGNLKAPEVTVAKSEVTVAQPDLKGKLREF